MPRALFASILLLALVVLASSRAAAYDKADLVAPEDTALVVFIQNLNRDDDEVFVVFDPDKECIAKVRGHKAEVVPMPPGKRTLYVTSYNTIRVELDLEAGRSYFIRLHTKDTGMWRPSEVTVLRGRMDTGLLKRVLEGVEVVHVRDDPYSGKPVKERAKLTQKRIDHANKDWNDGDGEYRTRHTVYKSDGLTKEDVDKL